MMMSMMMIAMIKLQMTNVQYLYSTVRTMIGAYEEFFFFSYSTPSRVEVS